MLFRFLLVLAAASGLSACATTVTLPPYQPITTAELSGAAQVRSFKYTTKSNVPPNVIHNTAAGILQVTDSVPDYFTNAVRRELRQAGLSLKLDSVCKLDGAINDLTIDDLGFSADWLSDVHYTLLDKNNEPLLDKSYQTKFRTDKFVQTELILASMNKVISDNIGQLIADPKFQQAINEHCPKAGS